jgi:hypothetical protein
LKLYQHKQLDCGFVILCPEHTVKLLQQTVGSIRSNYGDNPCICVTDETINAEDMAAMRRICPTFKGRSTFSSLINVGMKQAPAPWNFIVMAGSYIRPRLDQKFSLFLESEKDILYPIANGKYAFDEATINGLFMHKDTFKLVGDMANVGRWDVVKLMWAMDAIAKDVRFKAVANSKLC